MAVRRYPRGGGGGDQFEGAARRRCHNLRRHLRSGQASSVLVGRTATAVVVSTPHRHPTQQLLERHRLRCRRRCAAPAAVAPTVGVPTWRSARVQMPYPCVAAFERRPRRQQPRRASRSARW